jgi:hypothetical protein
MIRRPAIGHATGSAARVSWPDALIAAIDRLRAPAWVTYAVAAGCAALLLHVLLWLTGGLGRGQFSLSYAALAGWSIFCLAALDYLNRVAARAVAAFQPATDLTEEDARLLTHRLTNLPPIAAWLALPLAAAWAAGIYASDPTFFGLATGQGGLDAVIRLIGWINTVAVVLATMRGLWILAIVARSHKMIRHLNLFMPDPLFALRADGADGAGLHHADVPLLSGLPDGDRRPRWPHLHRRGRGAHVTGRVLPAADGHP